MWCGVCVWWKVGMWWTGLWTFWDPVFDVFVGFQIRLEDVCAKSMSKKWRKGEHNNGVCDLHVASELYSLNFRIMKRFEWACGASSCFWGSMYSICMRSSDLSEKWSEHSRQYCGMLMVMGLCRIVPMMTALKGCAVGVRCWRKRCGGCWGVMWKRWSGVNKCKGRNETCRKEQKGVWNGNFWGGSLEEGPCVRMYGFVNVETKKNRCKQSQKKRVSDLRSELDWDWFVLDHGEVGVLVCDGSFLVYDSSGSWCSVVFELSWGYVCEASCEGKIAKGGKRWHEVCVKLPIYVREYTVMV